MTDIRRNILILFFAFLFLYAVLISRLFYIQLIKHDFFMKRSMEQRLREISLAPDRGDIFDRNGNLLATTVDSYSIYTIPADIKDKKAASKALALALGMDRNIVLGKMNSKEPFVWINRKVDSGIKEKVMKLKLEGIGILSERRRIYPKGKIASQVLGFVGIDNQGLAGIELEYDNYLKGLGGRLIKEQDVKGRDILVSDLREIQAPSNGMNLTLTIDEPIQYMAEKEIKKAVRELKAKSGTVIVMDVRSGEILALAIYPGFDPNEYNRYSPDVWYNRAVTGVYEPGSTFKLVTVAAAINDGAITPNSLIYCPDFIQKGKRTIRNSHRIDFPTGRNVLPGEVLKQSINTGAAQIAYKLGKKDFYKGIRAFGFGQVSGIDLPGESRGILRNESDWQEIDVGTISFGQGIAVTPIQLISSLSSIANGGVKVKPRVVKRIDSISGNYVKIIPSEKGGRSVSSRAAKEVLDMSESVINEGTGKPARIKFFRVGGKTGTAQKPKPGGGYYEDSFVPSFIGFAPLTDPAVSVLVILDDPSTEYWGEKTAAPVFKEIMEFTLRRMSIPPDGLQKQDQVRSKDTVGMI